MNSQRWLSKDDLEGEEWRDVVGFEDYYEVSDYGRVRSKERCIDGVGRGFPRIQKAKIMRYITNTGYAVVILCVKGKTIHKNVHRLVCEAFYKNPLRKEEVNHIDGDKLNNHISNLEWCTKKENMEHAFRIGLSKPHHNQINKKRVEVTNLLGEKRIFDSIADAALFLGVAQSGVSRVCSGERMITGGCRCRFVI